MRTAFALSLLLWICPAIAQTEYFRDHALPFYGPDGVRLKNALSGGFSLPQFSQTDLNGDGWQDLMVFEPLDSQFMVFRNLGNPSTDTWRYDPSLDSIFAGCACTGWALMADYTHDGRKDLLCGTNNGFNGIRAYIHDTQIMQNLKTHTEMIESYQTLYSTNPNIPIGVSISNIPALTDADQDGDLDLLNMPKGYSFTVSFYRNMAYEELSRTDIFHKIHIFDECYGDFVELGNGIGVKLDKYDPIKGCMGKFSKMAAPLHGGYSTALSRDMDGDGDQDLVIGDLNVPRPYVLRNAPKGYDAFMDTAWLTYPPQGVPFEAMDFPAMFSVDTDNDSLEDILVTDHNPNIYHNQRSVRLYRDTSATGVPSFAYTPGFLQPSTLDMGDYSTPAFADLNADGLTDLVIGTRGFRNTAAEEWTKGTLVLLLNTGTAANPAFTLADSNYLHVADSAPNRQNLCPAFGDIDSDGDTDLLVGLISGKIMLYRNTAGAGMPASFVLDTDQLGGIDAGAYAAPALFDVSGDGRPDLVVGNERGWLRYFRQEGTLQSPVWTPVTDTWGQIKANSFPGDPSTNGYIKPVFADFDQDGTTDLITGEENGFIKVYTIGNQPEDTFLIKNEAVFFYDFGKYSAPALAVLDSTGALSLLAGNARGGLELFRTLRLPEADTTVQAPNAIGTINRPEWEMSPNPATDAVRLTFSTQAWRTLAVADVTGRILRTLDTREATPLLDVQDLPSGLYLIRVTEGNRTSARRLIVTP